VSLVHHDQTHAGQRREHGAASTHRHVDFAPHARLPRLESLALGERRVQNRDASAEDALETRDRLRRERDLGNEHDRASTFSHHLVDRV
jgi:hypothetical protein